MELWVNWRTRITHLTRDCHQLGRVPLDADPSWLERQLGPAEELTDTGRRYCSWCVARLLRAADRVGLTPDAELHPAAERADYVTVHPPVNRDAQLTEEARAAAEAAN